MSDAQEKPHCPTCGSDDVNIKLTSHFGGIPIVECSDPWHDAALSREAKRIAELEEALRKIKFRSGSLGEGGTLPLIAALGEIQSIAYAALLPEREG